MEIFVNEGSKSNSVSFFKNQKNSDILKKIKGNPHRKGSTVYKIYLTKMRFYVQFKNAEFAIEFARGFNKARITKDNLSTASSFKKSKKINIEKENDYVDAFVRGFYFVSKLEYFLNKTNSDDTLLIKAEIL